MNKPLQRRSGGPNLRDRTAGCKAEIPALAARWPGGPVSTLNLSLLAFIAHFIAHFIVREADPENVQTPLWSEPEACGDAMGIGGESGAFAIKIAQLLKNVRNQAIGIHGRQALKRSGHAGTIAAVKIIVDGAAVGIEDGHDREWHTNAEKAELAVEILKQDALSEIIELIDDFLDGKLGALGQVLGLSGDKDWRMERFVEPGKRDLHGPGIGGIQSCEVDQDDRPPLFDIEHAGEMRLEGFQKCNLPIEMMRQFQ
jgi:hypothetical protein